MGLFDRAKQRAGSLLGEAIRWINGGGSVGALLRKGNLTGLRCFSMP